MHWLQAADWLARREKHPERTEEGHWRWVLPDSWSQDSMADLPGPIFTELAVVNERCNLGADRRFPWLYVTRQEAIEAAARAVILAVNVGYRLPR